MLAKGVKTENSYNDCIASLKKTNESIETYFDLGDTYFESERWDNAIEQYKNILQLDPKSYRAYFNIGAAYLNKGKYEEAFKAYKNARNLAK